jgi:hypothetical protein
VAAAAAAAAATAISQGTDGDACDPGTDPDAAEVDDFLMGGGDEAAKKEDDWTYKQAVATPAFWMVSLADVCFSAFWAGFNLHAIDVLQLSGLSAAQVRTRVGCGLRAACRMLRATCYMQANGPRPPPLAAGLTRR